MKISKQQLIIGLMALAVFTTALATQLIINTANASYTQVVKSKKTLTDGAATGVFEIALPSGGMTGGQIVATVTATDGTELQSHSDHIIYSAVNKSASYTTAIQASNGDDAIAVSTGTLTVAWTITTGSNKITIQANADSSLTTPTIIIEYKVVPNSGNAITYL